MEDKNLDILFREIKEQFKYAHKMYDSLDKKISAFLIILSLFLTISFNSYLLEKLEILPLIFSIFHYFSILTLALSLLFLINLKTRKFKLIYLKSLMDTYMKNKSKDFRKTLSSRYIQDIDEVFKMQRLKNNEINYVSKIMKVGMASFSISVTFILIGAYII